MVAQTSSYATARMENISVEANTILLWDLKQSV